MSAAGARRPKRSRGRGTGLIVVAVPTALLCVAAVAGIRAINDSDGKGGSVPAPGHRAGTGAFTVARAKATDIGADGSERDGGHGAGTANDGTDEGRGGKGSRSNAYRVEVEDGTGVDPDGAAAEVARVLAAPRGWSHHGERAFRQVAEAPAGLVIRIATPKTTDAICAKGGLDTHGEVNCRVGTDVVVNLKRWQHGSPEFHGPLADYRALIINHEVGHWLGHGHETCPGRGRPAPTMMQQIHGLKGCVSNAWPYDAKGRYLSGPAVP
ncbi:DUF3152 domain-containing protein [Streptomyces sp. NPDC014744]|uniref:DUF3152 domain-containing protein n=1 Tax=Streptomyces sp. NPDC014744 TaxID=3364903 RepID=UPI0036FB1CDB